MDRSKVSRGTAGCNRVVPVRRLVALSALVALNANPGAAAAAPGAAANPANPGNLPQKVRLTKAQARDKALKLLSAATGETVEALAARFPAAGAVPAPQQQEQTTALATQPANELPELVKLERKRRSDIEALAQIYKLDEKFVSLAVANKWDINTTQTKALEVMTKTHTALQIHVGEDQNMVSLAGTISTGIRLRAQARCGIGKVEKPTDAVGLAVYDRASKFQALSLVDMGRQYLAAIGHTETAFMTPSHVMRLCMNRSDLRNEQGGGRMIMLAESIGDFPGILKDAVNKSLLMAYRDQTPTWRKWARRGQAPDFKTINRVNLSESPDLQARGQGGGIQYVVLKDSNETYALVEYVNGIKLTRQAMINDDLNAFQRIPYQQGSAAGRKEDDVAYAIITANAAMISDNTALFHANHGNLTTPGAAPSVAEVGKVAAAMRRQKGPAGAARLNIRPAFMLAPVTLETSAENLLNSTQLLAVISTTSAAPQTVGSNNPWANRLQLITDPRLDDNSTVKWYLAADPADGQVETVEVSFLEGEPEPVLRQEQEFDSEDQKFAVRHTVAAKALDFRGLAQDAGQ